MTKHLIFVFIIACLVGSCSPATVSPTRSPTATIPPILSPSPAPSATPTITPFPSLQTQGPHLLFTSDNKTLTIMDADASGWKQIELPNDGYIFQLNQSVSPDGNWLAYFTGSIEEPYDIALNLLNLSDETTESVSSLLAPDFPGNLEPIVETMVLGDPPSYDADCFQDMECRRLLIERELTNSLFSLDWSPNGLSIMFTAQIDGASSDLHIFSLQEKTISRFTDEPENIYSLDWAPNGQSILYQISSPPGTAYEGSQWRLRNLDGKQIPFTEELAPRYSRWGGHDWISENQYLLLRFSDVDPLFSNLKILNTDTGQVREVWPYTADSFAVNKETQAIIVLNKNHAQVKAAIPEGIYMVYPSGKYLKISDVGIQFVLMTGQGPYQVFSQDYESRVYNIMNNGFFEMVPWSGSPFPSISPDGNLLLYREYQKLALYNNSYELIKSWPMDDDGYTLAWNPDSQGIFIFTKLNVSYLSFSDAQPLLLLESCQLERCELPHFVWLP